MKSRLNESKSAGVIRQRCYPIWVPLNEQFPVAEAAKPDQQPWGTDFNRGMGMRVNGNRMDPKGELGMYVEETAKRVHILESWLEAESIEKMVAAARKQVAAS